MVESIFEAVRGLPAPLAVVVLAATPVVELRGAIPLGILGLRLPAAQVFMLAFVGNLLPVPVILFLLEPVSNWLRRHWKFADRFFERLFASTRSRHGWRFERWRDYALVTFVALPLPFTGAWAGALAAYLFGVPARRAIPLVAVGIAIAGCLVTALVLSGLTLFGIDH